MSDGRRYNHEYDDIIDLPHHTSAKHPRLPMSSRAAQFAPFAALTGFESVIAEEGRLTDSFTELDDDRKEDIDLRLELLAGMTGGSPEATFMYFIPDAKKEGGSYSTVNMGAMMACIMIDIVPIIIMYLVCQKYIIEGVVAGAVKG